MWIRNPYLVRYHNNWNSTHKIVFNGIKTQLGVHWSTTHTIANVIWWWCWWSGGIEQLWMGYRWWMRLATEQWVSACVGRVGRRRGGEKSRPGTSQSDRPVHSCLLRELIVAIDEVIRAHNLNCSSLWHHSPTHTLSIQPRVRACFVILSPSSWQSV